MATSQIVCLVIVVILAVLAGVLTVLKSKKHDLVKWIGIFIFVAIALTWIFGVGQYSGTELVDWGMNRQGLTDIPQLIYYALNVGGEKIVFLLALGIFYAMLSKCNSYKKLVNTIAEKLKRKVSSQIIFILVCSLIFTLMGAMLTETFAALIFVPFVVSIILAMHLDKMTAFAVTFGSILVGVLGTIYGGDGFIWFNEYAETSATTGIYYRLIVLVVAFILFNFFNVMHVKKIAKGKKINEVEADPFKVEDVSKKSSIVPAIIIMGLLFILVILGYISWDENFGISIFGKFHEWLMGLEIKDTSVFGTIFGTKSAQFGAWNFYIITIVLGLFSVLTALISRLKLNDFISTCGEGIKKVLLPELMLIGTYIVFVTVYSCQTMPTISNLLITSTTEFNPFLVAVDAFIANIFHIDLGLTGFFLGSFLTTIYSANIEIVHTIFVTLYGFVSLFVPTSSILVIGLSYLDIEYKNWIKYSWLFLLGILVILVVLFLVMAYI